jgi:pyruvate/2-oxoglutarate dehydrogenase complex dihydrolipoamide dehydrogenase (E3) component
MLEGKSTSKSQGAPVVTSEPDTENVTADICVIGSDPAGLAVATAAAGSGRSVVLIARHEMGGAALSYGPLARRALAAAANRANAVRSAGAFGVASRDPEVDMRSVGAHVSAVIAEVAPNFAAERYAGLGVRILQAAGRFINKKTVMAGELRVRARRFVIAAGAVPAIPTIPGLGSVPYLNTETIFSNNERLHNLIVIGGDAEALELAQACSRLGSRVIVLASGQALADEDPELSKFVIEQLAGEGISVNENTKVDSVDGGLGRVRVNITIGSEKHVVEGTHLLVASGRKPATADLGLEAAGIRYDERGIKVNAGLKTTNRRVFAVGEVAAAPGAEAADYQAGIVVRRALLHVRARVDATAIPRVVYTDPELASVGLSESEATKAAKKIHVLRWPYRENARAATERTPSGHIKVITSRDGKILGAGIVGAEASELIGMWALAIAQGLNLKAMTGFVTPYLSFSEINKAVATSYYAATLANPTLRKVIDFLAKFG